MATPYTDLFFSGAKNFDFTPIVNQGFDWSKYLTGDNFTKLIGNAGGLYGAWSQQRMANKNFKLQKDAFNYNKLQNEDEKRRRNQVEANFNAGF